MLLPVKDDKIVRPDVAQRFAQSLSGDDMMQLLDYITSLEEVANNYMWMRNRAVRRGADGMLVLSLSFDISPVDPLGWTPRADDVPASMEWDSIMLFASEGMDMASAFANFFDKLPIDCFQVSTLDAPGTTYFYQFTPATKDSLLVRIQQTFPAWNSIGVTKLPRATFLKVKDLAPVLVDVTVTSSPVSL